MKLNQHGMGAVRQLGTLVMSRAILAIGTAPTGFNTTNPLVYAIDGVIRQLAAQVSTALTTLAEPFYVQPANTTAYYTLAVNAAGTVRCIQGDFAGRQRFVGGIEIRGDGNVPDVPDLSVASTNQDGVQTLADQWCPFGVIRVVTGAATFTPGVTALNAAGVTATFFDVAFLPANDRL
jgi:hypothetical protein